MCSETTKIKRKTLPWQEVDGKVVILSPETTMSHELNETSSFVWKKIEQEIVFTDLLQALIDEFQVDKDTAKSDLKELIKAFKEKSLLDTYE